MLIAFLTPKIDPAVYDFDNGRRVCLCSSFFILDEDGPSLPTSANEEFRPFIRRLPEFKFWYILTT